MLSINGSTVLHGIIGNPVGHSLSPVMHNAAFAAMGINGIYLPMRVSEVGQAIIGLKALGFRGASVTIPHKETVIPHLDEIDPIAREIGAVNTLVFTRDGEKEQVTAKGLNTDWLGALRALEQVMSPAGRHVIIAGAGGSAKAVGYGLKKAGARVTITNRTESKGRELAGWLGADFLSTNRLLEMAAADVLINTTSVGMVPDHDFIVIDSRFLPMFRIVMDIVYAPLETRLLREAKLAGCITIDGLQMLLHQGAAQFEIWTGKTAPLEVMRDALERALASGR
ncbi:MAG: shikimate dehydrogenase [Desulfobulbaceae bacterium]|nr:shikimate dehydrogenase [Desulfobulbaceae bacterium]